MTGVSHRRRSASHADRRHGACVEPGAGPVHDVRLGVGAVLRVGRPVAGDDGVDRPQALPGVRRDPASAGRCTVRRLRRFGVPAVTTPGRARLRRRRQLQRRKPLERRTELRRTGRVYSDRRLAELPGERAARAEAVHAAGDRDGWRCAARTLVAEVVCDGGLDGHEPLTRARGGDPLNPDHIELICRAHHEWAHAHPYEAGQLGLLRHSWEGPIQR